MKKLILAIAICLIPIKVMSANFVDTLGAECARILFNLDVLTYPTLYTQFKNRNSQFYALEQCLKVYKQNGGDFEKINFKYGIAKEITIYDFSLCELNKKAGDKDCEINQVLFSKAITNTHCLNRDLVESNYPNFHYKGALEILCNKDIDKFIKDFPNETEPQKQ